MDTKDAGLDIAGLEGSYRSSGFYDWITVGSSLFWLLMVLVAAVYAQDWSANWPWGEFGAPVFAMVVVVGLMYALTRTSAYSYSTANIAQCCWGAAFCYGGWAYAVLFYKLDSGALSMGEQVSARMAVMVAGVVAIAGFALYQYGFQRAVFGRLIWQKAG
jgi:hypothetical protein